MASTASSNVVGSLAVDVRGNLNPLRSDLAQARRELESFNRTLGGPANQNGAANAVNQINRAMSAANDNVRNFTKSVQASGAEANRFGAIWKAATVTGTAGLDDFTAATVRAGAATDALVADTNQSAGALGADTVATEANTAAKDRNSQAAHRMGSASRYAAFQQRTLALQLVDVTQMLALGQAPLMTFMQQGPQIAQIYGPSEGGLGRAFSESAKMIGSLITKFPLMTAGALLAGGALLNIRNSLKDAGHDAIEFGDVIIGLFSTLADYIGDAFAPIAPYIQAIWDSVLDGTKYVINQLVRAAIGGYEILKFTFLQFPNLVAVGVESAANAVVTGIEWMVNKAIQGLNKLIGMVNTISTLLPEGLAEMVQIPEAGEVKLGRTNSGTARKELNAAYGDLDLRAGEIAGTDYVGQFTDAWRENSVEAMQKRLAKDGKKGRKGGKTAEQKFADIIGDGKAFIEQQHMEAEAIGLTEEQAAKLRHEYELFNKAREAGLQLSDKQKEELTQLAEHMAKAEAATKKLKETYEFAKETFKGFFTDIAGELRNGASLWEALGTAAGNALDKIGDKLLDMALNGLFDMLFQGLGGGGGGGILDFIMSGFQGFANGTSYAPGGMSWVGERGPELMKLPGGSQIIPNNRLASYSGGGSSGGVQRLEVEIYVKDDGKLGAIARQAGKEGGSEAFEVGIKVYDREQLPDSIDRVRKNPWDR